MKQPVDVEVLGQRLTLLSDDGDAHIHEVANLVDREARRLAAAHPRATILQLALLTALNLASERQKLAGDQAEVKDAIERISRQLDADLAP